MAISSIDFWPREREIIEKLESEGASKDIRLKAKSISDILVDIKRSAGKWTIAFIIKHLYQNSEDEIKKILQNLSSWEISLSRRKWTNL